MKNLIRIFLILLIVGGAISIHSSCSDENDCSLAGRPMMYCTFKSIDKTLVPNVIANDTLDSLTITALGTDSIILNNEKKVHKVMLPLRYTSDSTIFILRYDPVRNWDNADTLYIVQQNTPYFQSMECGYMMKQNIISAKFGNKRNSAETIDSIYLRNKEANTMKLRIYKYSLYTESGHLTKRLISLLLLFCIGLPLIAQQQRPVHTPKRDQKKKEVTEIDTIPFYNGTYVGVDLYGIGSKLLGGDFMSSEVSIAVNLKNKFIPTVEFGMGGTDTWSETGIHYKSKAAPFFRIGVDYNTMAKKKEKNSYLYAGIRYAFSSFKYDVSTLPADDPIWGDNIGNPSLGDDYWGGSIPFNHPGMKASVQWLEIVLGVKVRIYKNFNMGWSVRMKYKTSASTGEYGDPWYVPGYGKYKSNNMGITYSLIYKLPL